MKINWERELIKMRTQIKYARGWCLEDEVLRGASDVRTQVRECISPFQELEGF